MEKLFLCLLLPALSLAKDHPTLPTQWKARTIEVGAPGTGEGMESYNFQLTPTSDHPSAMWSNYTDCQRLIHINSNADAKRYLLGCEAVSCCWEEQDGNQIEFQIPNLHPANPNKEINVTYGGRVNITNFGETVEADEWNWRWETIDGKYLGQDWKAYTNDCEECVNGVTLVQWQTRALGSEWFPTQFKDYQGFDPSTDEGEQFESTFQIPEVCQGNILKCN